jgi:hypothetical protein
MARILSKEQADEQLTRIQRALAVPPAEENALVASGVVGAFNDIKEDLNLLREWYEVTRPIMQDLAKHVLAVHKLIKEWKEED